MTLVNTGTGEVISDDEYVDMILRNYEEANQVYQEAREQRERARQVLFRYMDDNGADGIPSEVYTVRRKQSYDTHPAGLEESLQGTYPCGRDVVCAAYQSTSCNLSPDQRGVGAGAGG